MPSTRFVKRPSRSYWRVSAGLTGYRSGILRIPWRFYHALLAGITSAVLYVILDIEYPRFGLIRLEEVNRILVELAKALR